MSLIHALIGRRAARLHAFHHHRRHEHLHRHFDDSHLPDKPSDMDARADRVARLLNLDAAQVQKLGELIDRLNTFRASQLKEQALQDLGEMLATGKLERQAIQAFVDHRLAQIQQNVPQVVNALGDFLDALHVDQQQTVQALLRVLVGRGAPRTESAQATGPEQAQ